MHLAADDLEIMIWKPKSHLTFTFDLLAIRAFSFVLETQWRIRIDTCRAESGRGYRRQACRTVPVDPPHLQHHASTSILRLDFLSFNRLCSFDIRYLLPLLRRLILDCIQLLQLPVSIGDNSSYQFHRTSTTDQYCLSLLLTPRKDGRHKGGRDRG